MIVIEELIKYNLHKSVSINILFDLNSHESSTQISLKIEKENSKKFFFFLLFQWVPLEIDFNKRKLYENVL